jgi:hypothetical protein
VHAPAVPLPLPLQNVVSMGEGEPVLLPVECGLSVETLVHHCQ